MRMNLRSVDLNLLTVFEAIMETGQLRRAADRLGMSQPAVSAALQRLRDSLGDELFIRTSQGVMPTPRAREIHQTTSQALEMLRNELDQPRQFDPGQCKRHFSLMGGDYVEQLFLGPLMATLSREAPGVSLEIGPLLAGDYGKALVTGEYDVAIHYAVPADTNLVVRKVGLDRLVVACRAGNPQLQGRLTPTLFASLPHVTLLPPESGPGHLERFMGNEKPGRCWSVRVTHFSSMLPVVLASDTLCVMPLSLARMFARHAAIEIHEIPADIPAITIHLVWAQRYEADRAHSWFRTQLLEVMTAVTSATDFLSEDQTAAG